MGLLDSNDTLEPELAFVTNISVNYETAERLDKLVEMFRNGDVRTLAGIQRIVTLPDCFQYFLPCLRDFVESCKRLIPTGIGPVFIEIFDAIVQHPEGKAALQQASIPDILREQLSRLGYADAMRPIVIRLLTRIK
jgi:hypothetical protein